MLFYQEMAAIEARKSGLASPFSQETKVILWQALNLLWSDPEGLEVLGFEGKIPTYAGH
jgi:hypothetical protein